MVTAAHCDLSATAAPSAARYQTSRSPRSRLGYLRLSENAATGDGGSCNGDSGGPNFFGAGSTETNVIAAISSTGDTLYKATNVAYRLDIPEAQNFLRQYVSIP